MAGPPPNMDLLWSLGQTGDRYPIERTITDGNRSVKEKWESTATTQPATSQPAGKTASKTAAGQHAAESPALPAGAAASVMPPATPVPPEVQYVPPAFDATDPAWTAGMADRIAAGQEGAAAGFDWSQLSQYGMPLAMMAMMGLMSRGKKGSGGGMAMLPLMMMLPQMMKGWGGGGTGEGLPSTLRRA